MLVSPGSVFCPHTWNAQDVVDDVRVNDETVVSKLNLASQFGEQYPYTIRFTTSVVNDEDGIRLEFNAVDGSPVINAIAIRRMY